MIALWIVLGILACLVAVTVAAGYMLYRFAVVRRGPDPLPDPDKAPNELRRYYALNLPRQMAWLENWGWQDVEITGKKGARLHGYFFKAKQPTNRTVLAIHGYRCEGGMREFLYFAPMYLEQFGMNLLLVDDYAHAQSEGKHIGFGWNDRLDCLRWIDWIIQNQGADSEILLQGVSLGAATVLMAAGEEGLPRNVRGVVADCAYSSVREELLHVSRLQFKVPSFPLYHIASLFCRLRAGYFFGQGDTLEQVRRIKVPVLFIHGEKDKFVPTEMVYRLYDACNAPKLLWTVPEAAHAECFLADSAGYEAQVEHLLELIAAEDKDTGAG